MTETNKYWKRKIMYLEAVTGHKIVEEYDKINEASNTQYTIATQPQQLRDENGKSRTNKEGKTLYDCFIYYLQEPEPKNAPDL